MGGPISNHFQRLMLAWTMDGSNDYREMLHQPHSAGPLYVHTLHTLGTLHALKGREQYWPGMYLHTQCFNLQVLGLAHTSCLSVSNAKLTQSLSGVRVVVGWGSGQCKHECGWMRGKWSVRAYGSSHQVERGLGEQENLGPLF